MEQLRNDTPIDHEKTAKRPSPVAQRVLAVLLVVMPCLTIVSGLLIGLSSSYGLLGIVGLFVTGAVFFSLRKNNPLLKKAEAWSTWSLQSRIRADKELDERERLVLYQALRLSYFLIAILVWFVGVVGLVWFLILSHFLHPTYHIESSEFYYVFLGTLFLVLYLPTAVVAWKEGR